MQIKQVPVYALRLLGKMFALLLPLCCLAASAQAQPVKPFAWHLDLSGDYSFVRTNLTGNGGQFNLNGVSGSLSYYINPRFSLVGDFGVYRFGGLPAGLTSTIYTYAFGPPYTIRHFPFGTPFVHALIGGGRLNASSGFIQAGENGLVAAFGGGLDIPLTHQVDIRAIQAEYLLTRFAHADLSGGTQNNVRISVGIVFRIAER